MIQAEIKDHSGVVICDVFIPQNVNEIKYSAFVEFSTKSSNIFDWVRAAQEEGKQYEYQYTMKVCDAVASVLNVDKKILMKLKYKDQQWIWDAWNGLHSIMNSFEPEPKGEFKIKHPDGTTTHWKIPAITKSLIRSETYADDLTFQQLSEISYIEKKLTDVLRTLDEREKKELGYTKEDDQIQVMFSYGLMKMAICLSDPNEIPTDATFDRWLDHKTILLQDINMKDGLNTIFFLINMPKHYGKMIGLGSILNQYLFADSTKRIQQTTMQG